MLKLVMVAAAIALAPSPPPAFPTVTGYEQCGVVRVTVDKPQILPPLGVTITYGTQKAEPTVGNARSITEFRAEPGARAVVTFDDPAFGSVLIKDVPRNHCGSPPAEEDDGFDWNRPWVGAGVIGVIALLGITARVLLTVRRRRRGEDQT